MNFETETERLLDKVGVDDTSTENWRKLCEHDRMVALKELLTAGFVTKTDQPDGSAILDYVRHDHPAVAIFREPLNTDGTIELCACCGKEQDPFDQLIDAENDRYAALRSVAEAWNRHKMAEMVAEVVHTDIARGARHETDDVLGEEIEALAQCQGAYVAARDRFEAFLALRGKLTQQGLASGSSQGSLE